MRSRGLRGLCLATEQECGLQWQGDQHDEVTWDAPGRPGIGGITVSYLRVEPVTHKESEWGTAQ